MPSISRGDFQRLLDSARRTERTPRIPRGRRARWQGRPPREQWYQLTARLDAGGTAEAHPGRWSAADATLTADAETTVTLTDTTGQHWGLEGEWVRARQIGGAEGLVYEVLTAGLPMHVATLSEDLTAGGTADATVSIGGEVITVEIIDSAELGIATGKKIASGSAARIWYDCETQAWTADWTRCANIVST